MKIEAVAKTKNRVKIDGEWKDITEQAKEFAKELIGKEVEVEERDGVIRFVREKDKRNKDNKESKSETQENKMIIETAEKIVELRIKIMEMAIEMAKQTVKKGTISPEDMRKLIADNYLFLANMIKNKEDKE